MTDSPDPQASTVDGTAVLRKVAVRLLPFLFLLYVVNLIDRTNVGMAKLQMVKGDPPLLDEYAFGIGAGLFYLGYMIFEVPSNLILLRVGARVWIARITVTWGLISGAMMFVTGPVSFYVLRVLLGVAEAGFFPGIIFYLSQWFPERTRGRAVATFMTGGVIASLIGNPLSGLILDEFDQVAGLWGWQWVFLIEGIPSILLGFVTLAYLPDRPETAAWLTPTESRWLIHERDRTVTDRHGHTLASAFLEPRVWLLIAIYFTVAVGDNVYGFFVPSFLESRFPDWKRWQIGLLAAVPNLVALIAMVLVGRHSDQTGERRWHVAASAATAGCGWLLLTVATSPWAFVLGLCVTLAGMKSMLPTFWAIPANFLRGTAAAGGVALINSIANIGGFYGPRTVGKLKTSDGNFDNGFLLLGGIMLAGGLLTLLVRTPTRSDLK